MKDSNLRGKISPRYMLEKRQRAIRKQKVLKKKIIRVSLSVIGLIICIYGTNILSGHLLKSEATDIRSKDSEMKATLIDSKPPVEASKAIEAVDVKEASSDKEMPIKEATEVAPVKEVSKVEETPVKTKTNNETTSIYNPAIPMPKLYQDYLYELCIARGLDYKKTLAVIHHESTFDSSVINETNDYGYFQINLVNHTDLAEKTNTKNNPLNPYININWGTYLLADLYDYWEKQGISGKELDKYVWSSYNRGVTGFKNNGYAYDYIEKTEASILYINSLY